MVLLLGVVFFLVPFLEIVTIFWIGPRIGWDTTATLLVVLSAAGAWLMKREGLGTWRRIQSGLRQGRMPTSDAVDGLLLLLCGALLLCPGFVTSSMGVVLLLPPVRSAAQGWLAERLRREVARRVRVAGSRLSGRPGHGAWAGATAGNGSGAGGSGPAGPGPSAGSTTGPGEGRAYRRPEEAEGPAGRTYREVDVIDVDGEEIVFEQRQLGSAER